MAKRTGLGKGLDSLISTKYTEKEEKNDKLSTKAAAKVEKPADKPAETPDSVVKISLVEPNRTQPRKVFDEDALQELAESIKRHGILQPLLVTPVGKHYEIVAGERRWRAAKLAGLKEVPVIIRKYDRGQITEIALIENIQREDLNPMEEAQAYQQLIDEFGLKQEELAQRVAKSRAAIANHLRLLKLVPEVQELVRTGQLTEGHARALLGLEQTEMQAAVAREIIDKGISVRETEALVKRLNAPAPVRQEPEWRSEDTESYAKLESDLREMMNTKVTIRREDREKGRISIDYYSLEELERLTELIRKGSEAVR